MNTQTRDIIQAIFEASNAARIHFKQVIGHLRAQVESYHVDYRSGRTTCFRSDNEILDLHFERRRFGIGQAFDGEASRTAIRAAH